MNIDIVVTSKLKKTDGLEEIGEILIWWRSVKKHQEQNWSGQINYKSTEDSSQRQTYGRDLYSKRLDQNFVEFLYNSTENYDNMEWSI